MLISKIGEFGLIERFKKSIKTDSSVIVGSGDDCAVLEFDKDKYQLWTCDMLVGGIDFVLGDNPYLVGKKAIGASISDIAACAGIPRYCLISLALPKSASVEFLDKFFKGIVDIARRYNINIVGGDLSRAREFVIDISMSGVVEKKYLCLRKGAEIGDIIFVSGKLGGSIRGKHLNFTPRLKEARFLAENFKPNSMIDISDGLIQDLSHILEQSRKGAVIYESLVPVSKQARSLDEAFYMGEDFELLFTLPRKKAKNLARVSAFFKPIGEIMDKKFGLKLIDKKNKQKDIRIKGFRHF